MCAVATSTGVTFAVNHVLIDKGTYRLQISSPDLRRITFSGEWPLTTAVRRSLTRGSSGASSALGSRLSCWHLRRAGARFVAADYRWDGLFEAAKAIVRMGINEFCRNALANCESIFICDRT